MHVYAIALGSNRRHGRHGSPAATVRAAASSLGDNVTLRALSPIFATRAMGDRGRTFANAAAMIETPLGPPALLAHLKALERAFGRRPGKRWGPRVLDLDILLWSKGRWQSRNPPLAIPHPGLAERRFVLDPLVEIAPQWKIPGTFRTVTQMRTRLTAPRPLP
jgi:2-amino-4-hydroxy-6-hydroxymethyldihydropteridine diphosphokinase